MQTWHKYLEQMGGGLPQQAPNYTNSARPYNAGGSNGTINIGQSTLTLQGNALQIDTENNSVHLALTPQQVQQLQGEFSS